MTVPAPRSARAEETRFRGRAAISLVAGRVAATFLPGIGMTGVSLQFDGREHLALPGGVPRIEQGGTAGLPLLAPWANRLASHRFRAAGVDVDLDSSAVQTDGHGLPIHGLLLGATDWQVTELDARGDAARLGASVVVDRSRFPFPHRIDVLVTAREQGLEVDTTISPTGRRPVPIGFGWHPYLRLPGPPRPRLPARRHLVLDRLGLTTGEEVDEPAERAPSGARRFDDLYALGRDRRLALLDDDGHGIELCCESGYPCAQVWVPPGRTYAALEPMAAPTNALVTGSAPSVRPDDRFTARFTLTRR